MNNKIKNLSHWLDSTKLLTVRRLLFVVALSCIAGIPIGQYMGATQQLQSDEDHIKMFAATGTPLLIGAHSYNITLNPASQWSPGLQYYKDEPMQPQEPAVYNIAVDNRTVNGEIKQ